MTRSTEIGSLDVVKERVRDVGWETLVTTIGQDVRYGLRRLRRAPAFATVAILTLAIVTLVVKRTLSLTAAGIVLGLIGAALVTRYLEGMLFGLTPLDPASFAGVTVMFGAVALLAASVPARRATKVDPLVAIRGE